MSVFITTPRRVGSSGLSSAESSPLCSSPPAAPAPAPAVASEAPRTAGRSKRLVPLCCKESLLDSASTCHHCHSVDARPARPAPGRVRQRLCCRGRDRSSLCPLGVEHVQPTPAHSEHRSWEPSMGHQWFERLRVHVPATQPTTSPSASAEDYRKHCVDLLSDHAGAWPGEVLDLHPARG